MPVALSDSAAVTGLIVASASVLTAFITVGGTVLVTRLNASTTQQQKEMDKDQRLEEYRRELVEKRRDERRDVYLRWIKAAQDVQAMIAELSSSPSPDRTKALAAMKPLYEVYDELALLDSPDDLVKLAAYTQRHQRAFINGRVKFEVVPCSSSLVIECKPT